ncbi:MAG TPA: quinone-dependent dihydroorotate dehydrogenase [Enteractinococcus helveticum]|uniref:Dihydroorotate dehydrogenase (quinone) n=1 Tax=Enteractinococcus helveticum TaxID=1837282 RepID=A0A921FKX0_9MICC|nr:quinone-dependent dihydroorotate dehydrogenase [Enteractinococcus helveticum]HJF14085.1 quinone-dependent dihydroorotate dehydrogenase [Enteractinococcus helveticum]
MTNLLATRLAGQSPKLYPHLFNAVFADMDAERAHELGFRAIRVAEKTGASKVLRAALSPKQSLRTQAMGLTFPSPFGLAAGFDKAGIGTSALADLGFGHIEVGTITGQEQPGNPQPRLFRLPEDRALINRMGFNNHGAQRIAPRLATTRKILTRRFGQFRPILGVNIGKSKVVELEDAIDDYLVSTQLLARHADYLVVNVSSPNTPGLRQLQAIESLAPLLAAVSKTADAVTGRHVPLAVKIAPDLVDDDVIAVADMVSELGLDGIIATNTTISRNDLTADPAEVEALGAGGVSGAPLAARSMEVLDLLAKHGTSASIISVGGVTTGQDVIDRLEAGATLVQGYTAFLYEGPLWVGRINAALENR